MAETFYDVLGVDPGAEESEITEAYRERIKETHPDVSDAEDAEERSKMVIEAKEVLTDADERARYDRLGHESYLEQTTTDASWSTGAGSTGDGTVDGGSGTRGSDGIDWSDGTGDSTWSGRGAWRDENESASRRARRRSARRERTDTTSADGTAGASSNVGGPVGWATSSQHAVRDEQGHTGVHRSRLFPPTQSIVLLVATFVCYPALVFSSVFPPFPLIVNVVVGFCTLFLIAYLTSMPEVGVYVFGGWSVLGTVAVFASSLEPLSIVGVLVLGSAWFPLGLTVLTYRVLRW